MIFKSVAELQNKIDEYFITGRETKTIASGNGTVEIPIYTISGLAYFLGFTSRQRFYDYENYIEYADTIKRARLRIESIYEANLQFNNATGSIFALKNLGWSDKQEIEHSGGVVTGIDYIVPNEVKD